MDSQPLLDMDRQPCRIWAYRNTWEMEDNHSQKRQTATQITTQYMDKQPFMIWTDNHIDKLSRIRIWTDNYSEYRQIMGNYGHSPSLT